MFTQCFTEFGDRAELVPNWGVEFSECFFFFSFKQAYIYNFETVEYQ